MRVDTIPSSFWRDAVRVARRLGMAGHELDLLRPLMNESGLSARAHNAQGNAAGLFQAMPFTLLNMGFTGGWQAFCALDEDQQLPWLEHYYRPYTGKLVNATAVYMATFCPGFLSHASDPHWLICAYDGSIAPDNHAFGKSTSALWYTQNHGLDVDGDHRITVDDLTAAIAHADTGPEWARAVELFNIALAAENATDTPAEPLPLPIHPAIEIPDNDPIDRLPSA